MEKQNESKQEPSSIGTLWPPEYDQKNDRVKGFYNKTVHELATLDNVLSKLYKQAFVHEATRITARFVADNDLFDKIKNNGLEIECATPLDEKWAGYTLVYFGINSASRKSEPADKAKEHDIVKWAQEEFEVKQFEDLIGKPINKGYQLELLKDYTQKDVEDIVKLYKDVYTSYTFDLNEENVKSMLNRESNITGICRAKQGEIVGIGIAETCDIPVELQDGQIQMFKMAEMSDAATSESHAGRGLYAGIGAMLLRELAKRDRDFVYGEARAGHKAVNVVCKQIGREYMGVLEKHCEIGGRTEVKETGNFENLNVLGLTRKKLINLYGNK